MVDCWAHKSQHPRRQLNQFNGDCSRTEMWHDSQICLVAKIFKYGQFFRSLLSEIKFGSHLVCGQTDGHAKCSWLQSTYLISAERQTPDVTTAAIESARFPVVMRRKFSLLHVQTRAGILNPSDVFVYQFGLYIHLYSPNW